MADLLEHNFSERWDKPAQAPAAAQQPSPRPSRPTSISRNSFLGMEALSRLMHSFEKDKTHGHEAKIHPHVDSLEMPDFFRVYVELPGVEPDDLHLDVDDHQCIIVLAGKCRLPHDIAELMKGADLSNIPVSHWDRNKNHHPTLKWDPHSYQYVAVPPSNPGSGTSTPVPAGYPSIAQTTEGGHHSAAPGLHVSEHKELPGSHNSTVPVQTSPLQHSQTPSGTTTPTGSKGKHNKLKYLVHERKFGRFQRAFQFPVGRVHMDQVTAQFRHGVLCITVPRNPSAPAFFGQGSRKLDVEVVDSTVANKVTHGNKHAGSSSTEQLRPS